MKSDLPNVSRALRKICLGFFAILSVVAAWGAFPVGTPITPYLTGQNYWFFPPDSGYPVIQNSGVTLMRIGGHTFDETAPLTNAQILHQVDLIRSIGAEPLIQVSRFATAATAAATVQFINITNARAVKFWSIGNEPDLNAPGNPSESQIASNVAVYIKQFSPAMRDVDPSITIIAPDMAFYSATKYNALLGGASDITGKDIKGRYYIDCVSFHRYGGTSFTRSDALNDMHSDFENSRVVPLLARIASANALQGRTGSAALTWALTEFNITTANNPSVNTPAGYGVSSFLNGQFFAEYYRVAMKYGVAFMNTWSLLEGGGNGSAGDLGYLGGTWAAPVPRSSYCHMQMISDYLVPGGYLPSISSSANLAVISTSTVTQTQLSVMLLNEDTSGSQAFTIRMDDSSAVGGGTRINVSAGLAKEYSGTIDNQSTVVLLFDVDGVLKQRITYSLTRYQQNLPPLIETFSALSPVITQQPTSQAAAVGATVTLSVSATSSPAATYQWFRNGTAIGGATSASLTLSNVQAGNAGSYNVVVTNSGGTVTSNAVTLTVSQFPFPTCITVDSAGNLYVGDSTSNTIQKISTANVVSLFAGAAGQAGSADGNGSAARFNQPAGIAVDSAGTVYVADTGNATLRKITASGAVSTLAGSITNRGNRDSTGTDAWFSTPIGVTLDAAGNIYVADASNHTVRKVTSTGVVTTIAGAAGIQGNADGTSTAARFNYPSGLASDSSGNLGITDTFNHTLRTLSSSGTVATLAGLAGVSGSKDGTGSGAFFNQPSGLARDATGNYYVADTANSTIRKVTPAGTVSMLAGLDGVAGLQDGTGINALFNQPKGVTVDSSGNIYVADTGNSAIRKVTPAGAVTTLAATVSSGSSGGTSGSDPGSGSGGGTTPAASSGGGGGGAPSLWFYGLLSLLVAARLIVRPRLSA